MDSEDKLAGFADPALLNKIDKLFACGVGDYIDLPQIIVVGDQSSGKSSVLEGLINLPFPRDAGLCTRFATQITFRREKEVRFSVSIIPSKNSSSDHVAATQAWRKDDLKSLDGKRFADIMREVHEVMNLGGQSSANGKSTFSEDILKLDICGPEKEHFSVVDVPGIFRVTTEGVTTTADKHMVEAMVRRYMENPRSVMLAVIPSNVDIATQEILTMAKDYDPDGIRTLGVLTKPDLVDPGAEKSVIDLVEGQKHPLNLGWCIVRNPGQQQLGEKRFDRDAAERSFFASRSPWNSLDKEKVGVLSLKLRLQQILGSNTRRTFPQVKKELMKKLSTSQQLLKNLGDKRDTTSEQRKHLLNISARFEEIVNSALVAKYTGTDLFDRSFSLKFPTRVADRNEQFAAALEQYGHSYELGGESQNLSSRISALLQLPLSTIGKEFTNINGLAKSQPTVGMEDDAKHHFSLRLVESDVGLEEIDNAEPSIDKRINKETMEWLTKVYRSSRGFELGTFDSSLLAQTMKTQSAKWDLITMNYVYDVIRMAHEFVQDLLQELCSDERIQASLMSLITEDLHSRYRKAIESAQFLLSVERMSLPITLNHYFNDNLQKSRLDRLHKNLSKMSFVGKDNGKNYVALENIIQSHQNMSNIEHVVQEVHDILRSYYKVARKRFVDNICMQSADYHLVSGPDSPLRVFSSALIYDLSAERLEEIAGEDVSVRRKREALNKEIEKLETGRKILL